MFMRRWSVPSCDHWFVRESRSWHPPWLFFDRLPTDALGQIVESATGEVRELVLYALFMRTFTSPKDDFSTVVRALEGLLSSGRDDERVEICELLVRISPQSPACLSVLGHLLATAHSKARFRAAWCVRDVYQSGGEVPAAMIHTAIESLASAKWYTRLSGCIVLQCVGNLPAAVDPLASRVLDIIPEVRSDAAVAYVLCGGANEDVIDVFRELLQREKYPHQVGLMLDAIRQLGSRANGLTDYVLGVVERFQRLPKTTPAEIADLREAVERTVSVLGRGVKRG